MKTQKDVWLFRIIALDLRGLSSLMRAIILAAKGLETPQLLVALESTAIGGLPRRLAFLPLKR